MRTVHGTIHDDAPAVPEPPVYIGMPVDIEEQRELFRQVEARRAAALHNARPAWHQDYAGIFGADHIVHQARERVREEEERMERVIRLQRQREAEEQERRLREQRRLRFETEEWDRRLREQRRLREAEQRRREQEAQQGGGWGCTIM